MPNPFCSTFISDGVLRSALSAKISLPLSRFSDCQISQQGAEQAGMDNAILKKSEWRPFFFFSKSLRLLLNHCWDNNSHVIMLLIAIDSLRSGNWPQHFIFQWTLIFSVNKYVVLSKLMNEKVNISKIKWTCNFTTRRQWWHFGVLLIFIHMSG